MRNLSALIISLLVAATTVRAQIAPASGSYAIVDVRVEVGDGRTLDRATILLRDGIIQAVGPDLKIPAGAEVIKGTGLVAYPGFIDAGCTRGLKLPEWQPDQDTVPDTSALAPASMRLANRKWVRPELRARDCLALTDPVLAPMRRNGFCAALFTPDGGLIGGVSALANLNGLPRRDCILRGSVGMNMSFSPTNGTDFGPRIAPASGTGYPGSLLGFIADLRQTLLDAGHQRATQAGYERSGGARPAVDDCIEALQPVLDGATPVFFAADSKVEIDRALRLADEFHLRLVLTGAGEAWKVAPVLARRNTSVLASLNFGEEPGAPKPRAADPSTPGRRGRVPVPVQPNAPATDDMPAPAPKEATPAAETADEDDTPKAVVAEQHGKWAERVTNAVQLEKASIPFAFTTTGLRNPADFWKNLRRSIKEGLPKEAALRALTLNPAKILGVDKQLGTLQVGKMANVVLMTGDFADSGSHVKYLIIDKSRFEPDAEPTSSAMPPLPAAAEIDDDGEGDGE